LDWPLKVSQETTREISFQYKDDSGLYFGSVLTALDKEPEQSAAVPVLERLFSESPGELKILRVMGVPVKESSNAVLVEQLETNQNENRNERTHHLVVSRTGNWFEFTEGSLETLLPKMWANFNFHGGQYIALSIDGVAWTDISEEAFWRTLQQMESSQKVKENSQQLALELEKVLEKHKN
jgi:hypothetical protein